MEKQNWLKVEKAVDLLFEKAASNLLKRITSTPPSKRRKPQGCSVRGCRTAPFVKYNGFDLSKLLCRKHMLELERRGRRLRDFEAMGSSLRKGEIS